MIEMSFEYRIFQMRDMSRVLHQIFDRLELELHQESLDPHFSSKEHFP
jgi:hypothetical protein